MEDMASSVVISAMWCREVLLRWSSYFLLTFMVAVGGWMERFASSVGPRRIPASGVGGVVPVSGKSLARSTWNLIMGILRLVDDPMSLIDFLCAFQGAIQCWVSLYETEIMIAFIIHLYLGGYFSKYRFDINHRVAGRAFDYTLCDRPSTRIVELAKKSLLFDKTLPLFSDWNTSSTIPWSTIRNRYYSVKNLNRIMNS